MMVVSISNHTRLIGWGQTLLGGFLFGLACLFFFGGVGGELFGSWVVEVESLSESGRGGGIGRHIAS
jgi:hypothetical protein